MLEGLYEVEIFHARTKPVVQKFTIRGYTLLTDVARLDGGDARLGCGHTLRRRDFSLISNTAAGAQAQALAFLKARTGMAAERVFLLANPRIAGYIFNPVSFFFYYRKGSHVATVVEVNNTFGEQKHFIELRDAEFSTARKDFYVSPFISPFANFKMRIAAPAEKLSIGIHTEGASHTELVAEMRGARHALTRANLLRFFIKYPFHTRRVITLIHWYALKLLLKRVPHFAKDAADAAVMHGSFRSQG